MIYDLKKRAEEELVNNLGHFWLKLIDNENGGFYGEVTYDLKANKKSCLLAAVHFWCAQRDLNPRHTV